MARYDLRPRHGLNAAPATANAPIDEVPSKESGSENMVRGPGGASFGMFHADDDGQPYTTQQDAPVGVATSQGPTSSKKEATPNPLNSTPIDSAAIAKPDPATDEEKLHEDNAPTQCKCHKVLNTTEILEHILTNLSSERDILRCIRVSTTFKNTIRGSIKLQRRLFFAVDNTVLTGIAVKRQRINEGESSKAENGGRQGIPANERLLRTNPFIIRPLPAEPYGEDQYADFCPNLKTYFDHRDDGVDLSIGEMFLTQPPVSNVRLAFGWWGSEDSQLVRQTVWLGLKSDGDGVKVKDVKKCFEAYLEKTHPVMMSRFQDALKGRHDVALKVRDGYEVMDLGPERSNVVYTDDTMADDDDVEDGF
ncbi:unnamed protein product [Zymoseptoria tritici ST99CH_1A5]|uniref:F-box domain-containing protein n=2 Tax=Zymoseptoria tritici TaxID=1047171 RepID=A0A2H1GQ10_ZYMTR|nr:unnamed protein product [Zymoseptoria tritici ST99CH_1E4]SMY26479.1 unnamed protein product [Zymoseptoria tritici ST99CH_1A5]